MGIKIPKFSVFFSLMGSYKDAARIVDYNPRPAEYTIDRDMNNSPAKRQPKVQMLLVRDRVIVIGCGHQPALALICHPEDDGKDGCADVHHGRT